MTRTQRTTLIAAILGSGIATIDGTAVNVALPAIERDLGGGLQAQQWVANAYLLALRDGVSDARRVAYAVCSKTWRLLVERKRALAARARGRGSRPISPPSRGSAGWPLYSFSSPAAGSSRPPAAARRSGRCDASAFHASPRRACGSRPASHGGRKTLNHRRQYGDRVGRRGGGRRNEEAATSRSCCPSPVCHLARTYVRARGSVTGAPQHARGGEKRARGC
jgi:hypothetical protein